MTDRTSAVLAIVSAVVVFLRPVPIILFGRGAAAFELLLPGAIGLMLALFLRSRSTSRLGRPFRTSPRATLGRLARSERSTRGPPISPIDVIDRIRCE